MTEIESIEKIENISEIGKYTLKKPMAFCFLHIPCSADGKPFWHYSNEEFELCGYGCTHIDAMEALEKDLETTIEECFTSKPENEWRQGLREYVDFDHVYNVMSRKRMEL